jgi:hypothetical protein
MKRLLPLLLVMSAVAGAEDAPPESREAPEAADAAPPAEPAPPAEEAKRFPDRRDAAWTAVNAQHRVREAAALFVGVVTAFVTILCLGALLLFTSAVAPQATARASVAVRDHPIRSFGVGIATIGVGTLLAALTAGVAGILLLPVFTAALFIGLAGVSEHIGRNVTHLAGKEGNRVGHLAAGWSVFSLVSLCPFIGWFGFFPYYTGAAVGAFFTTILGGRARSSVDTMAPRL